MTRQQAQSTVPNLTYSHAPNNNTQTHQDLFGRSFHNLSMSSEDWNGLDPVPACAPPAAGPECAMAAATASAFRGVDAHNLHSLLLARGLTVAPSGGTQLVDKGALRSMSVLFLVWLCLSLVGFQ